MQGDLIEQDPASEATFDALVHQIAWELSARLAVGDRVDTPEGIRALAKLVADTILDGFVVRTRTEETSRYTREV
jgi:hypothetical protein